MNECLFIFLLHFDWKCFLLVEARVGFSMSKVYRDNYCIMIAFAFLLATVSIPVYAQNGLTYDCSNPTPKGNYDVESYDQDNNPLQLGFFGSGCHESFGLGGAFGKGGEPYQAGTILPANNDFTNYHYVNIVNLLTTSYEAVKAETNPLWYFFFDDVMDALGWNETHTTKPNCPQAIARATCSAGAPPCAKDKKTGNTTIFRMPCAVCQALYDTNGPCGVLFANANPKFSVRVNSNTYATKLNKAIENMEEQYYVYDQYNVHQTSLYKAVFKFMFEVVEDGCDAKGCYACGRSFNAFSCETPWSVDETFSRWCTGSKCSSNYLNGSFPRNALSPISVSDTKLPYMSCAQRNLTRCSIQASTRPENETKQNEAKPATGTLLNISGISSTEFANCDPYVQPLACFMEDQPVSLNRQSPYCAVRVVPGQNTTSAQYIVLMDLFFSYAYDQLAEELLDGSSNLEQCKLLLKRALCPILAPPCTNQCSAQRVPCTWCKTVIETPNACFSGDASVGTATLVDMKANIKNLGNDKFLALNQLKSFYKAYDNETVSKCHMCKWSEQDRESFTPELIKSTLLHVFTVLEESCYQQSCNESKALVFDHSLNDAAFKYRGLPTCPTGSSCNGTGVSVQNNTETEDKLVKNNPGDAGAAYKEKLKELDGSLECNKVIEPGICYSKTAPVSSGEKDPFCAVKQLMGKKFTTAQYVATINLILGSFQSLVFDQLGLNSKGEGVQECIDSMTQILCFAGAPPCTSDCTRHKIPCQWCIDFFKNPKCQGDKLTNSSGGASGLDALKDMDIGQYMSFLKGPLGNLKYLSAQERDTLDGDTVKSILAFAFEVLLDGCNKNECVARNEAANVFDPDLKKEDVNFRIAQCPSAKSCSSGRSNIEFELVLVGLTAERFDESNFKKGLASYINSYLPTTVVQESEVYITSFTEMNRRRLAAGSTRLQLDGGVEVAKKLYKHNTSGTVTLSSVVNHAVTEEKSSSASFVSHLSNAGLQGISDVQVTRVATVGSSDDNPAPKNAPTSPDNRSSLIVVIIIIVIGLTIVGGFVWKGRKMRKEKKRKNKKDFSKEVGFVNPLKDPANTARFLQQVELTTLNGARASNTIKAKWMKVQGTNKRENDVVKIVKVKGTNKTKKIAVL